MEMKIILKGLGGGGKCVDKVISKIKYCLEVSLVI